MASCRDSPVEIHPLLGELPVAMVRILKGFILDDLHPFSAVALFMAVLADHVQLSDFVLQNTQGQRGQSAPRPPSETAPPPALVNGLASNDSRHFLPVKEDRHMGLVLFSLRSEEENQL